MKYVVNFFDDEIFIDKIDENGDYAGTYLQAFLPEGETAKQKVINTFCYIANKKELGIF